MIADQVLHEDVGKAFNFQKNFDKLRTTKIIIQQRADYHPQIRISFAEY